MRKNFIVGSVADGVCWNSERWIWGRMKAKQKDKEKGKGKLPLLASLWGTLQYSRWKQWRWWVMEVMIFFNNEQVVYLDTSHPYICIYVCIHVCKYTECFYLLFAVSEWLVSVILTFSTWERSKCWVKNLSGQFKAHCFTVRALWCCLVTTAVYLCRAMQRQALNLEISFFFYWLTNHI